MAEARNDEACRIADEARNETAKNQAADWLAPSVLRRETGRVGAEPEKRRVPERHDAGVTENEIEREGKQRRDGDLARERKVVGKQPVRQQRRDPECDF